jgi:proline iminopeptidase
MIRKQTVTCTGNTGESGIWYNGLISFRALIPGYFYNREKGIAARKDIVPAGFGQESLTVGNIMYKDYTLTSRSRTTALKKYPGRVDLLQGRQDPIGETTAFETKTFLKQARISFIEKCGHIPWLESDEIAAIFFDRLQLLVR